MKNASYVEKYTVNKKPFLKGRPLPLARLDIELTERCNNNCLHCYINLPADDLQAKERELTTTDIKGILKEVVTLGCLSVRFTGGEPLLREDFEEILNQAQRALEKEGFTSESQIKESGSLFVGNIKLGNILQGYNIAVHKDEKLLIKVEINQPERELEREPFIITGFGYSFSILLMVRSHLISEKLATFLNRKRGRDIYDILFMLRKKFPFNSSVLDAVGIKDSAKNFILGYLRKPSEKELKFLADQVKPFLFKEDDIELILKAPFYAEKFLEQYPNAD